MTTEQGAVRLDVERLAAVLWGSIEGRWFTDDLDSLADALELAALIAREYGALFPATPTLDDAFGSGWGGARGEYDGLVVFVKIAARNMFVRLREKSRQWGMSWRTDYYSDAENIERLQRAVDHLVAAVDIAHRDDAGAAEMGQPWRRAADVANQAFMLADPLRGWSEDAARRAARLRENQHD